MRTLELYNCDIRYSDHKENEDATSVLIATPSHFFGYDEIPTDLDDMICYYLDVGEKPTVGLECGDFVIVAVEDAPTMLWGIQ